MPFVGFGTVLKIAIERVAWICHEHIFPAPSAPDRIGTTFLHFPDIMCLVYEVVQDQECVGRGDFCVFGFQLTPVCNYVLPCIFRAPGKYDVVIEDFMLQVVRAGAIGAYNFNVVDCGGRLAGVAYVVSPIEIQALDSRMG